MCANGVKKVLVCCMNTTIQFQSVTGVKRLLKYAQTATARSINLFLNFTIMKLHKVKVNFTQISNNVIADNRLSAKAKGIYCYLYSKPDNWDFSADRIAHDFTDGEKAIRAAIKELEKCEYLQREKLGSGRMVYYLHLESQTAQTGSRV